MFNVYITFLLRTENDCSKQTYLVIENLISKMIESASLAVNMKFCYLKVNDPRLKTDLTEV